MDYTQVDKCGQPVSAPGEGPSPLMRALRSQPLVAVHILLIAVIWVLQLRRRVTPDKVAFVYQKVVRQKELWRIFSATYSHGNFLHVFFNMTSLWNLELECRESWLTYCRYSIVLVYASVGGMCALMYVLIHYMHRQEQASRMHVGYSGVVFGWMAYVYTMEDKSIPLFGFLPVSLPAFLHPWALLVLISLIVPRASFVGHLMGIFAGYAVLFGLFDWFDGFCLAVTVFWTAVLCLVTLKQSEGFDVSWIECDIEEQSPPRAGWRRRVVNGVLGHYGPVQQQDLESLEDEFGLPDQDQDFPIDQLDGHAAGSSSSNDDDDGSTSVANRGTSAQASNEDMPLDEISIQDTRGIPRQLPLRPHIAPPCLPVPPWDSSR